MIRIIATILLGLCINQVSAATISTYGANLSYEWGVTADANVSGTHFVEDDSSSVASSITQQFSGGIASPIPNKTYDTSPVLFQQPDGSFAPNVTFDEDWIHANTTGEVQVSPGIGASTLATSLFSTSTADARHSTTWLTGVGDAYALAELRYSSFFSVAQETGEANIYTLRAEFLDWIIPEILTTSSKPDLWSLIDIQASIFMQNMTTGEVMLNEILQYELFQQSYDFNSVFGDLSFNDEYWFELYLSTGVQASSAFEIIFSNPSCNPAVESCIIDEVRYDDVRSTAFAEIDFTLAAEATVVPLPAAAWLFGSALLGIVGLSKWRRPFSLQTNG